jgi:hypothetical protein
MVTTCVLLNAQHLSLARFAVVTALALLSDSVSVIKTQQEVTGKVLLAINV